MPEEPGRTRGLWVYPIRDAFEEPAGDAAASRLTSSGRAAKTAQRNDIERFELDDQAAEQWYRSGKALTMQDTDSRPKTEDRHVREPREKTPAGLGERRALSRLRVDTLR